MNSNFANCLAALLHLEGGFVDNPKDPGGATNLGVTMRTWEAWEGRAATVAEIRGLTPADVAPLYRQNYWGATGCDDWPAGVDLIVFDAAVNQGPVVAVRLLQTAVGVQPDGLIGPATNAAVAAYAGLGEQVIRSIYAARLHRYRLDPEWAEFGKGWVDRINEVLAQALDMAKPK